MKRTFPRLLASPGVVLMVVMAAALASSPAFAHDLHDEYDDHAAQLQTGDITALVRAFRETGDDEYLDRAQGIIEPQLEAGSDDAGLLVNAALVAQARHEFSRAADLTQRAIAIRPNDIQAWLLLASIHLVRGQPAKAGVACRQLRDVPLLVSMTCQARVELTGVDVRRAFDRFTRVLDVTESSVHDSEVLAWSLSVAGDLAKAVDEQTQAMQFYTRSLSLAESTQVRSALVDVLIEQGAFEDAANVIEAGAPALPLEVRRMIVSKKLGRDVARDLHRANHEFQHWIANEDWLHAREMARFYIDVLERPTLAQDLAHINLSQQREPEDLLLARRTGGCSSCVR